MSYSLIVDIGNSQIEFGFFSENSLIGKTRFETQKLANEYDNKLLKNFISKLGIKKEEIEGGMIFSVVPHLTRLVQIIIKGEIGVSLKIFDPKSVLADFKADIDNKEEVGQDLIADILGAIHYYGAPVVVTDLGTVTKNIIIDKDGVFQGVSFFPGLTMNARVLSDKTAQLPHIDDVQKPKLYFGKNTIDAMTSGIYYCHIASVKRFMERTDEYFGYTFKKVITGGFANFLKDDFDSPKYIVDPELVLKGMHLIYKNQK